MSKELIKELIAGAVDGDYHSFASATGKLVESKMKGPLSEAVADIKASLFEKKKKDDEYEEDYGIGDKLDVNEEGNTAADQNFNNDQQQQALSHVGQITFAESDETGGPAAAKKRVKNSSVDVSLGKAGPDETSSSDQKAKFNSDTEEPGTVISPKDKKNKGSVKIKAAGKDTAGTDVISDSVVKGSETAVNPEDDTYDDSGYDVHEDDEDKYEDDDDDKKSRSAKEIEKDADDEDEEETEDKIDRKEKMKDKMRYSDDEKNKDKEEKEEAAEYEEAHADDYDDEMDYKEDDEEEKEDMEEMGMHPDEYRKGAEASKKIADRKRASDAQHQHQLMHPPKPSSITGGHKSF